FPAGGGPDVAARLLAPWLSDRLGQSFVVEDRPGAGGTIATEAVVRAAPDGHTLLCASGANAINAALYENLSFDFIRDIAPVARIGDIPFVMVVTPSLPTHSVAEFIAYAKANPHKVNMASAGVGSFSHVSGALFKSMAGVDLLHVPYRASFMPDLLAGQVHVAFTTITFSIGYIRSGTLRPLAVTSARPCATLPELASIGEFVPGYEAIGWLGVGAPRKTPDEIVATLNREINAALAEPKLIARLADVGVEPTPMTPAAFGKLIADDIEKWGKVIRAAGIRGE
ncbi:MAG TPA: tripartite tricarboxylate transporter substrate binding protein, partial [Xanthobacteraceae bacterium]|nr:tripartite tricarboxylate transporter substrate binding protein [Xanthobacteraceae bacterium]